MDGTTLEHLEKMVPNGAVAVLNRESRKGVAEQQLNILSILDMLHCLHSANGSVVVHPYH